MSFDEILTQVLDLLRRQGRVSYGALKRRYALDGGYLQDLKDELIDAQQVASDEDGKVLVWKDRPASSVRRLESEGKEQASSVQTLDSRLRDSRLAAAERRQLTVMFCDLVGSTSLSTQLDPEDLRAVVQEYQATSAAVIERYEGYIAQYLGDGLLVYFGYPMAHEDDTQRAVRAGVEIIAALQNRRNAGDQVPPPSVGEASLESNRGKQSEGTVEIRRAVPLQVRIGIHTGLVVVGEIGGGTRYEQLALGETPNIAARIQGVADPDTITLSAISHRLLASHFVCKSLGMRELKGLPHPIEIYQVLRERSTRDRLDFLSTTSFTPLVGRDEEVEFLLKCWERVKEGHGQVILLSGEPGIGKSRLVQVLKERTASTTALQLEARCSSYHQNSALYPMIEFLQRVLRLQRDEAPEEQLLKLERALSRSGVDLQNTVPFFASLLALPPTRFPLPNLTPQKQREKTQQAMLVWFLKDADRQPLLSVWEDLHWADPSTVEWLGLLIEQIAATPVLVVLTFRPEFTPPWPARSHLLPLSLSRLGHKEAETMVARVIEGKKLPVEVKQQIVMKTDGVPLFVEELTKMVLESGLLRENDDCYELTGPLPPLAIPATLQDSLLARLDRLATAREIAQVGATLGREFSYELIQAVSPSDEENLQKVLTLLVEAEVLYQRGVGRQTRYLFRHALIQDAAYQSLLKSKRQQYHLQTARVLEERFPEMQTTQPEIVAHHYTEAGLGEQALSYWKQAGQNAIQRSANKEAISHLTKALDLLNTLPETIERTALELSLQLTLGVPLMATRGYAASEVEQAYARARELSRRLGETPQLFPALGGLFSFYLVRGELRTARALAEQCLRLAESVQVTALLVESHRMLGNVLIFAGEFAGALAHCEQALSLYDPQQHRSLAFSSGQDPGVVCKSFAAWSLRILGYPERALQRSDEALTLAQELGHANSLALAMDFAASLRGYFKDWQGVQTRAEAAIALATEHGLPFWAAWGTTLRGWALAGQGRYEEGLALMHQGIGGYRATGAVLARSSNLCIVAESYGAVGQIEEGLEMLTGAFAVVHQNGERMWESELYRVKGELTLQSKTSLGQVSGKSQASQNKSTDINPQSLTPNPQVEAEACFLKAIEIARQQEAKLYELRATMSLSRLWQQQGKQKEAHQMLAEIYGWFTEGWDTVDLTEAKHLLDALAHPA